MCRYLEAYPGDFRWACGVCQAFFNKTNKWIKPKMGFPCSECLSPVVKIVRQNSFNQTLTERLDETGNITEDFEYMDGGIWNKKTRVLTGSPQGWMPDADATVSPKANTIPNGSFAPPPPIKQAPTAQEMLDKLAQKALDKKNRRENPALDLEAIRKDMEARIARQMENQLQRQIAEALRGNLPAVSGTRAVSGSLEGALTEAAMRQAMQRMAPPDPPTPKKKQKIVKPEIKPMPTGRKFRKIDDD